MFEAEQTLLRAQARYPLSAPFPTMPLFRWLSLYLHLHVLLKPLLTFGLNGLPVFAVGVGVSIIVGCIVCTLVSVNVDFDRNSDNRGGGGGGGACFAFGLLLSLLTPSPSPVRSS